MVGWAGRLVGGAVGGWVVSVWPRAGRVGDLVPGSVPEDGKLVMIFVKRRRAATLVRYRGLLGTFWMHAELLRLQRKACWAWEMGYRVHCENYFITGWIECILQEVRRRAAYMAVLSVLPDGG